MFIVEYAVTHSYVEKNMILNFNFFPLIIY